MKRIVILTLGVLLLVVTDASLSEGWNARDPYHPRPAPPRAGTKASRPKPRTNDIDWDARAQDELQEALQVYPKIGVAKNVILFIGDGMGVTSLTAGRLFRAQEVTGVRSENAELSWETFPFTGLIKTYNTDQATPDSAGTATAFLCGEKTKAGVIGVNQDIIPANCSSVAGKELRSILHQGQDDGKWAGVVTTTRITHATPASGFAHSASRSWENDDDVPESQKPCDDIAMQLVRSADNQPFRVIMGGGRYEMTPVNQPDPEYPTNDGYRTDGADLIQEWLDIKAGENLTPDQYKYVNKKSDLDSIDTDTVQYLLGLFEGSHMKYEADRLLESPTAEWQDPSLADMVHKAIEILSKNDQGFVMLVEGGRIDHAHHDTNGYRALMDLVALQDAVQMAVNMTSEDDTLIVLTADHSHTLAVAGYPNIDNNILDQVVDINNEPSLASDQLPYLTLGYANGQGYDQHRPVSGAPRVNVSNDDTRDIDYLQDTNMPMYSETHGGEDVAVYARGPMSQLFTGQHEQNYIAHAMMYASCIGANKELCETPPICP